MGNNYLQSLSRFAKSITSELTDKLAGEIALDLRPVVDPLGDDFANLIAGLQKSGTLGANQAAYLLAQSGWLPDDLPDKEKPPVTVLQPAPPSDPPVEDPPTEGGDN